MPTTASPASRTRRSEKPACFDERRVEFVHGGGEGGLVGQQPPAHAGPLRSLPGVQEHRAGAARTGVRRGHARSR